MPVVELISQSIMAREFIGFSGIADQAHRKSVKKGFEFTLMVVGESGLGKTTLVNALFRSNLNADRKLPPADCSAKRTINLQETKLEIEEKGVKLRLTVVDTPGFGDGLDGNDSWKACSRYVDEQFASYYDSETGFNRKSIIDNRVHCCLYFIPPYGRGLRYIDIEFMKNLQYKVNLIPIIAKADSLTPTEVTTLKAAINRDIEDNNIEIYQFPDCESDEDEAFKSHVDTLKSRIPFAVVGSTHHIQICNRDIRGRQYPWGVVEVDNEEHSDFGLLRRFLIQTHMQDLKDVTHEVHYENYRIKCLKKSHGGGPAPVSGVEAEQRRKDELLKEKDQELEHMKQMLSQMSSQLANHQNYV